MLSVVMCGLNEHKWQATQFCFFSQQSVFKGEELFHFREEAGQSNRFILLVFSAQSLL